MAKRAGFSPFKNATLGFLAAGSVIAAKPAHTADDPFQTPSNRGVHVRFVRTGVNLFSGPHHYGFFLGRGQRNGANILDLCNAVRDLSITDFAIVAVAAVSHVSKNDKPMELNLTSASLFNRTDDLNLGKPTEGRPSFAASYRETAVLDPLSAMGEYPKQYRLNYKADSIAP